MTAFENGSQMKISSTVAEYIPLPPPPWEISTGITPTPMEALSGEFAIGTYLKGRYLTAVGGGGRSTDVIHTDAIQPRGWETFKFWVDSATHQHYAFQTVTGNFITAVDAGGRSTDTIHSDATVISTWEMFKLLPGGWPFASHAIQTLRGFLLTAVGGGGHNSGDTIHTDAVNAAEWEWFNIFRRGDFGTGSTYGIEPWGGPVRGVGMLAATSGGRVSGNNALITSGGPPFWISWTLLKQDGDTYAFQTASGGILTANGGGLPGEGFRTDTETDQIGNWEKFTLVDNGDFTAYIKTYAGTYLTATGGQPAVTAVTNVNEATRWGFYVVSL